MGKQATLPAELYENTIENMEPGSSGWTVPWAMHVDEEGYLWLNSKFTVDSQPGGTVTMLVKRTQDGYEVEMGSYFGRGYRWSPGTQYVGGSNSVPVTKFTAQG